MLQGIRPGKCYVEMSTVDPETITELSQVFTNASYPHTTVASILRVLAAFLRILSTQ